jgi:hypothetical protein
MKRIVYTALLATALMSAPAMANTQIEFGSHERYNSAYSPNPDVIYKKDAAIELTAGEVMKVQTALDKAGFHPGPIDGVYGVRTRAAVQGFQEANNLAGDGQVTFRTLTELGIVAKKQPLMRSSDRPRVYNN